MDFKHIRKGKSQNSISLRKNSTKLPQRSKFQGIKIRKNRIYEIKQNFLKLPMEFQAIGEKKGQN